MTTQNNVTGHFGVLVSDRAMKTISKKNANFRLKQLARANKKVDLNLFFFSISKVNTKRKVIKGYYYDQKSSSWKLSTFPYPDVLYRRGGVTKNFRAKYRTFIRQCKDIETYFINPSTLGNWDIYNYFGTLKSLKSHLLQTLLYEEPEDLFYMLRKHKIVYLKGVTGRKGEKVVRIESLPDNQYLCAYYNHVKKAVISKTYEDSTEMISFIKQFYNRKKFIIQEAIDLIEVDNRRIDLRAELQRNKNGEIEISGISARMSQENSPITIHSDAFPLEELFEMINLPLDKRTILKEKIENFLCKVYQKTEERYGKFAEIGIDFALTKDLQLKFIECNSQSAKVSLMKAYGKKTLNKAMVNILNYGKYLILEKQGKERLLESENMKDTAQDAAIETTTVDVIESVVEKVVNKKMAETANIPDSQINTTTVEHQQTVRDSTKEQANVAEPILVAEEIETVSENNRELVHQQVKSEEAQQGALERTEVTGFFNKLKFLWNPKASKSERV